VSQNVFHWAGKLPNRVGMPNRKASYFSRDIASMIGYEDLGPPWSLERTSAESVSLILQILGKRADMSIQTYWKISASMPTFFKPACSASARILIWPYMEY
jgi:hypothetical protein